MGHKIRSKVMLINSCVINNQITGIDNYFPLGLLCLGTTLKNQGIDVIIKDVNNDFYGKKLNEDILYEYIEDNLCQVIKEYKPDIIGISCIFSGSFKSLKMIAGKIKDIFPKIPIAIGGIHPTIFAKEILTKYHFIDYVVIGEGESTFLKLVRHIEGDEQRLEALDGIAFRQNGSIKINAKRMFEDNLDALPLVDYSLLNMSEYNMDTSRWYSPKKLKVGQPFNIISSRSCPQHCTFCSMQLVHGPKIRFRSANNVLDEIEYLYNKHNVRYFEFMDDNMTYDKKRTIEICDGIIKRKLDIQFSTPNGVAMNRLDEEIIDAMVKSGMVWISAAPESGSEYIRNKVIGKGLSNEKIYETIKACAKHSNLFIKGFFLIGMPQETNETLEETFKMIKELPFDKITVNFATAYPGTELFDYCIQNNLMNCKMEDYVDVEVLQSEADKPHFKPHKLRLDELINFQKKCYSYLKKKRETSTLPDNYPLRCKGFV